MQRRYLIHGVLPAISAACCFAIMSACVKLVADTIPASMAVFLRNSIGLFFVLPLVLPRGIAFLKTKRLKTHLIRSLFSLCAMTCFFLAIGKIGLAEATLLNTTSPIFITLLAVLFLGEKINRTILLAIVSGFVGVALILNPQENVIAVGALFGLASGFFIACTKVLIRHMASSEPVLRTMFYFSIFSTLYSTIPLIWFWKTPDASSFTIMIIAALSGTAGQLLLTYSFTHNPASKIAPFSYSIVVIATIIGWIGWQELPSHSAIIGALIVISACIVMTLQGKFPDAWRILPRSRKK